MRLTHLLKGLEYESKGNLELLDAELSELVFDSRKAKAGTVFLALKGTNADGHDYIDKAISQGAEIVVCERIDNFVPSVLYIQVGNSHHALGIMACNFYDNPSKQLKLVGVTGTNGKTTVATLLYKLFRAMNQHVGLISTVENRIDDKVLESTHTTPDPVSLNKLIAEMRDSGCDYVFMEVSSHAVDQDRIAGLDFDGAIFTNISHDHLDYHGTFQNYIYAKKKFFDQLPSHAFALVNYDDKRGMVMLQNTESKKYGFSLKSLSDFKAKILENSIDGLLLEIDGRELHSRLVGDFNAYNLLSVYATALLLGEEKDEVLELISNLSAAEGRFDYLRNETNDISAIVDYAHTPDALEKVLLTLQKMCGNGRIITVVGCGGDRDKSKRPLMAKIASNYSDIALLTSDNPRSESPEVILAEMESGIQAHAKSKVLIIADRRQAIKAACRLAQRGDIVLVAGKGHEKYQEINGIKNPFDDKEELLMALEITNQT
jgi:UDP-N-acetylmuramoyl-L-alanyl-D-glutamate--2,6-diaminopimelate ligase